MSEYGPTRMNLTFPRIIEITESRISFDEARTLIANLLKDKRLERGKSMKGYTEIPIQTGSEIRRVDEVLENLLAVRYIREKPTSVRRWVRPISGPLMGELTEGKPAYFDAADLVWYHPNLIMLRGPDDLIEEAYEQIAQNIGLPLAPDSVNFTPYFLLWLLLEFLEGRKDLGHEFTLEDITSMKAFGIQSMTGSEISIENVDQIFNSIPATSVILDGLGLRELKCTFLIGDVSLVARIYSRGGIWVYVTDYLSSKTPLYEKFAVSMLLVRNVLRVFKNWSRLPRAQREPSEEKYREIGERALKLLKQAIDEGPRRRRAAQRRRRR